MDRMAAPVSGVVRGGEAEMGEDFGNPGGSLEGGDDLQGAAARGTRFNIDSAHPFEQPGPAAAGRR
jgi:hypothetical protein